MDKSILILHGPNLNLLGQREPDIYGTDTLESINIALEEKAQKLGYLLQIKQENGEKELIEHIQENAGQAFIIINPAAFTHTSIAMRDALAATNSRFIEVHLSNVYAREPFRHHSFFSDLAIAIICGCGAKGYQYALEAAHDYLRRTP